jgi:hypothetical protein
MLPNGDFEQNARWDYKLKNWVKIKERGAQVSCTLLRDF